MAGGRPQDGRREGGPLVPTQGRRPVAVGSRSRCTDGRQGPGVPCPPPLTARPGAPRSGDYESYDAGRPAVSSAEQGGADWHRPPIGCPARSVSSIRRAHRRVRILARKEDDEGQAGLLAIRRRPPGASPTGHTSTARPPLPSTGHTTTARTPSGAQPTGHTTTARAHQPCTGYATTARTPMTNHRHPTGRACGSGPGRLPDQAASQRPARHASRYPAPASRCATVIGPDSPCPCAGGVGWNAGAEAARRGRTSGRGRLTASGADRPTGRGRSDVGSRSGV